MILPAQCRGTGKPLGAIVWGGVVHVDRHLETQLLVTGGVGGQLPDGFRRSQPAPSNTVGCCATVSKESNHVQPDFEYVDCHLSTVCFCCASKQLMGVTC
jgi:hypothetical protein